jgi:DNA-directed RNA polymerase specialized sigma subunit
MEEINSLTIESLTDVCKNCENWADGKGSKKCLSCEEIEKALPLNLRPDYKVKAPPMIPLTFQEESYNPFEEINKYSDRIDILIDTLKEFPVKQELIFLGRYFLGLNFETLSSIFNLSESRIRGITSKILKEFKQNKSP